MSWPPTVTRPSLRLAMPQMMLISVVLPAPFGPEQREDLAALDVQIDVVQRLETGAVGFERFETDMMDGIGEHGSLKRMCGRTTQRRFGRIGAGRVGTGR